MGKDIDLGINRTGTAISPAQTAEMTQGAQQHPVAPGDGVGIAEMRRSLIGARVTVGSMPPPATARGVVQAAANLVKDVRPNVLLDRLGERLAFERTGARLYEALLAHVQELPDPAIGLDPHAVLAIRDAELRHFKLVRDAIVKLGGDPTVMTPAAVVAGVVSSGVLQAVTDPRTSRTQCLCAILTAELADAEGWHLLSTLTRAAGHEDWATRFDKAQAEERTHVDRVRGWLEASTKADLLEGRVGVEA
ncbi:MAG: ferritin-like domain-containing protein [Myxococcota bacterium]